MICRGIQNDLAFYPAYQKWRDTKKWDHDIDKTSVKQLIDNVRKNRVTFVVVKGERIKYFDTSKTTWNVIASSDETIKPITFIKRKTAFRFIGWIYAYISK